MKSGEVGVGRVRPSMPGLLKDGGDGDDWRPCCPRDPMLDVTAVEERDAPAYAGVEVESGCVRQ